MIHVSIGRPAELTGAKVVVTTDAVVANADGIVVAAHDIVVAADGVVVAADGLIVAADDIVATRMQSAANGEVCGGVAVPEDTPACHCIWPCAQVQVV